MARIRAKTLFGEKYVDLDLADADEQAGPFLRAGDTIEHTEGGFELEAVLSRRLPAPPGHRRAGAADGDQQPGRGRAGPGRRDQPHARERGRGRPRSSPTTTTRPPQFLHDLAALSDQLADSADDLVGHRRGGQRRRSRSLNDHEAELITILQQTGRLSNDVADLLLGNQPFVDAALGDGSKAVQVLYDRRTQVMPLVIGLRQYVQTLTEVIRISVGDGTLMGAVKAVLGNQLCARDPVRRSGQPRRRVHRPRPARPRAASTRRRPRADADPARPGRPGRPPPRVLGA